MISNFSINERCQNILVNALRTAFTANTDYTYIPNDLDNTGIVVYRSYPKILPAYPVVIVETPSITDMPRTFGHDIVREVRGILDSGLNGVCYQVYGGGASLSFNIAVTAKTSVERERILDWIVTYLRHTQREYIEAAAIDIFDVRRNPETVEIYGADLLYISSITVDLFCEWERVVYYDGTILELEDIDVFSILPDGTTTS